MENVCCEKGVEGMLEFLVEARELLCPLYEEEETVPYALISNTPKLVLRQLFDEVLQGRLNEQQVLSVVSIVAAKHGLDVNFPYYFQDILKLFE